MNKILTISIIIPAKNEASSLVSLLPKLTLMFRNTEIIVVDDGSVDNTIAICENHNVKVISHPYSMGNGAAIKTGARNATGDIFVFMDADGQHKPEDIPHLIEKLLDDHDMAVGARTKKSQAGAHRAVANGFYNKLASWIVDQPIKDLTSGFRAIKAKKFRQFLYLLPNGFSYPTTITMSFFRAGYSVCYVPILAPKRIGKSHIRPLQDGIRFLLIIFKIGTLYSPLKLFLPISATTFLLGLGLYAYTYTTTGHFTNMSALLFTTSLLIFLIGLVSEQITSLMFNQSNDSKE